MGLSVGIITYNEEKRILKTLEAVHDIADEIVIVDSMSTDNTVEIANKFNAKVYFEDWMGYSKQKNSVIEKCSNKWILLIDADEVITEKLKSKIKKIVNEENEDKLFLINRSSICFGKKLKYGGWSNQYAERLFLNGKAKYGDTFVHEKLISDSKKEKIKEEILHYSYLNFSDYLSKFNKYTTLGAVDYYNKGKKSNFFNIVINPVFKFIKMYILRLGFLDGLEGLLIAIFSAMYTMTKYYKLLEIERNGSYIDGDKK